MHGEQKGLYGGQEVTLSVHLQLFKVERLLVKQFSIVDNIIELCVKWSWDPGSVVLSPNMKFLSSVFIYGKPVRSNAEILFLSGSGEQGSVIVSLKDVALYISPFLCLLQR